jgi:hypothetical protein
MKTNDNETVAARYGYSRPGIAKLSLEDVETHDSTLPVLAEDAPVPPIDTAKHNPPGTDFGYPEGYPSAAGELYTGEKK